MRRMLNFSIKWSQKVSKRWQFNEIIEKMWTVWSLTCIAKKILLRIRHGQDVLDIYNEDGVPKVGNYWVLIMVSSNIF